MEDLAYRRLLDQYYIREGALPTDIQVTAKLVRMRSMTADVESVLREFFVPTEAGWRHERCEHEIAKMRDKQAKARDAAEQSVKSRRASAERRLAEQEAAVQRPLTQNSTDVELPTPTPTPTPIEIHSLSPSATACPHDKLIDLYAQHLPNLPQPRKSLWLKSKNAPALRSRWQWVMTECHESGSRKGIRLATTEEEGLEWFCKFFSYVNDSDFLTGRNGKFNGCDLGWLMTLDNFSKTLQGNYHPVKAAA